MHAVDVAVQTELSSQSDLPTVERLSGSPETLRQSSSAIAKPGVDLSVAVGKLSVQETGASDAPQQRAGSSDAVVQHRQDSSSQPQQQEDRAGMLQDDATSVKAQHSTRFATTPDKSAQHGSTAAAQEIRPSQGDTGKSLAQHSRPGSNAERGHDRGRGIAQHSRPDSNAERGHDRPQENVTAAREARVSELSKKAEWTQGLQLPEQLTVSLLAKHAGVDKAFMQVCTAPSIC